MIGIYKITNKLNNRIYIGQSIHCGKRLDEHCKGKQFIDEVIQVDGVENFSFEILKSVEKDELNYWEDYFIMKFKCKYPDGYNKRWNTNEATRKEIQKKLDKELQIDNEKENYICFPSNDKVLKEIAYNDVVYAWLLLHSHYNKGERHNYIYKNEFTFSQIAKDIHRHRDTVSKRFKDLIAKNIIYECESNDKKFFKMPYFDEFETLHGPTVLGLITLPINEQREELVKTYAFLLKQRRQSYKKDLQDKTDNPNGTFMTSAAAIGKAFEHSLGHTQLFDRMRLIFTILQGAGIIEYEQTPFCKKSDGTFDPSQLIVYKVYPRASDKWLGMRYIS